MPSLIELACLSMEVLHSKSNAAAAAAAEPLCDAARSLIRQLLTEGAGVASLSVVRYQLAHCACPLLLCASCGDLTVSLDTAPAPATLCTLW